MKILRVGDPHVKISNIAESKELLQFVLEQAKKYVVNRIEILGDAFHTHAVLRLEVQEFWTGWLTRLGEEFQTVVLVGNHDMSGNYNSTYSALSLFSRLNLPLLQIVESPKCAGVIGYVPYIHNHAEFIAAANGLADQGCKVLVCHQTLQGSRYESGFYAADGVPTGEWSARFTHIISGHIHAEQSFENIIYPGTARWDSAVDANIRKGIWIFEHNDTDGSIISAEFISTENVCSPLKSISWTEGSPEPERWGENERVTLELIGSAAWIAQQKIAYKGLASFKTKITDTKKKLENRKAGKNLEDYLQTIFVSNNKANLLKCAKEIGLV